MAVLLSILLFLLVVGLMWGFVCGIYALACFIFGWAFSWPIALLIFLGCLLLKWIFGR